MENTKLTKNQRKEFIGIIIIFSMVLLLALAACCIDQVDLKQRANDIKYINSIVNAIEKEHISNIENKGYLTETEKCDIENELIKKGNEIYSASLTYEVTGDNIKVNKGDNVCLRIKVNTSLNLNDNDNIYVLKGVAK